MKKIGVIVWILSVHAHSFLNWSRRLACLRLQAFPWLLLILTFGPGGFRGSEGGHCFCSARPNAIKHVCLKDQPEGLTLTEA